MIRRQHNHQLDELYGLVEGEIDYSRKLLETLNRETEILVARDTFALESITALKVELITRLKSAAEQRETLLTELHGEPLKTDDRAAVLWQDLMSLAAKCREKNHINGSIIEIGYRQSQQALDILQGTARKPELYDHAGHTTRSGKSNTLARA
ncbi:MAG: flagellar protein FlgN [Gammaproteobacteria bacterium]|nr:flagellar protein FlgN [Gammaproteobacteria bacterium]